MRNVIRCLAILAVIGIAAICAFADQSYQITLGTDCKIGNLEFKAGEYKLVVDAPKVRLTDMNSRKTVELDAKVEDAGAKNAQTAIHSQRVDGITKVTGIHIGGSKTRIAFD